MSTPCVPRERTADIDNNDQHHNRYRYRYQVFAGKQVEMTTSVAQPSKAVGTSGDDSCEGPVGGADGLGKEAVASS